MPLNSRESSGDVREGEDTYIPDFAYIAAHTGLAPDALASESVTIPTRLFRFLMKLHLRRLPFDGRAYARANPDVAEAFRKGEISSLCEHYAGTGWFENRPTGWYFVDEAWYQKKYFDIANAHKTGKITDLGAHFYRTGRREGRVASASQLAAKAEWDGALKPDR